MTWRFLYRKLKFCNSAIIIIFLFFVLFILTIENVHVTVCPLESVMLCEQEDQRSPDLHTSHTVAVCEVEICRDQRPIDLPLVSHGLGKRTNHCVLTQQWQCFCLLSKRIIINKKKILPSHNLSILAKRKQ